MVTIFDTELDLLSFIPALFGAILSLYNWWQMRRPALIVPSPIVSYGLIASEYQEGMLFCFPIVLNNEGAQKAIVTKIRIGFKHANDEVRYLDLDGKARLEELDAERARLMDWEKFQKEGYMIRQPTYPIVVNAYSSENVYLIARSFFADKEVPLNVSTFCRIEVTYNNKKVNYSSFPFKLDQANLDQDDQLQWLEPVHSE